jgi:LEA14-like dessication related protein
MKLLFLFLFILTGCAGLGSRLEPPRITLANIKVQEVKIFESILQIDLRVYNTNDVSLDIQGIDCDLELNDRRFATGVSKAEIKIASYDTALIPMIIYSSVLDVVRGLQNLSNTDNVEYKITGHLRLGGGAIPSSIPFKTSGTLSLRRVSGNNE